jgi:hypothetical protein
MSRKIPLLSVILICLGIPGFGQAGSPTGARESLLSLSFVPGMSIPLGTESAVFGFGYGGDIAVRYRLPSLRALALGGVAGYEFTTLQMDASLLWEPLVWLGLRIQARGGYFHSFLNDGTGGGGNGFASGGAAASFGLFPGFEVSAEIGYRALFGFSQNLVASLGATYRFAPPVSVEEQLKMMPTPLKGVRLESIGFDGVFPVFYKYYDDHPIGKAVLRNTETSPLEDLKVTVYVQQYMANPKVCATPARLATGGTAGAEAVLAVALEAGVGVAEAAPLVTGWFRECLAWEARHGYFGVLEVGRIASLFPRPPIPRDTVRTWPPYVRYAADLRRLLREAGDPGGARFFEVIGRELSREFREDKVMRGCVEAMKTMMERNPP